ncbi:hypothetical protein [Flavivirga eckloniae]|uniref:Uncharacterized protein n=1 Tax=Flavivirga eckloniae TaxID=1803846 RepID=A0A2K9PL40_9FLAO|nr:hypothetical protein [Flavivirga eckloniae]AUP77770.1 hypothetical protein C1H87_03180 [Flavivirga eckloniae]
MGLDMIPLDKPKPGFEDRYTEIHKLLIEDNFPKPPLIKRLLGKKHTTRDKLFKEWLAMGIKSYETIKAPRVGTDKNANIWIMKQYDLLDEKPPIKSYINQNKGLYVIELAKEQDGVPDPEYCGIGDRNIFRGEYLKDCIDLIGEKLVNEAWKSKLADETLDYGHRLMKATNKIARKHDLEYLKDQKTPPGHHYDHIESKIHLLYAISKWLIFYGENGHGYEAEY